MTRKLAALAAMLALTPAVAVLASAPALAQFFPFFGNQQQPYYQERREAPQADYDRAPPPKKRDVAPTNTVAVMGDAMADWLAFGLEEAFADTPEIGILRKHRRDSGLNRYDSRDQVDWAAVARDVLTTDKPAVAVMMFGLTDRDLSLRERPGARTPAPPQPQPDTQQQAQQQTSDPEAPAEPQIIAPESPTRGRGGAIQFRSELWGEIYSKRIADTIAAMKSRGVPVIWVGMPSIRGAKSTGDAAYLNGLYRAQAEKAGIIYVDVWDGFVDEAGRFASSGPDVDGQTRRLRAPDGVYYTRYGARKLAHFVEREIRRVLSARTTPVALPVDGATQPAARPRADGPVARPLSGAVLPLTTANIVGGDALVGGGSPQPLPADPIASRVLVKGEPVSPLKGRADDFMWPLGGGGTLPVANTVQEPGTIKPQEIPVASTPAAAEQKKPETQAAAQPQRRPRATQSQQQPQRAPSFFSPFGFFR